MIADPALSADYAVVTEGAGLLDQSDRGRLALSGSGAKEFLHGQVSNDIVSLTPGHGVYAALLTPKGKMRGDLRVLDTGDELLLDTERVALQELFNTIRSYSIGYDVQLHKRTLETSELAVVGPEADAVVGRAAVPDPAPNASDPAPTASDPALTASDPAASSSDPDPVGPPHTEHDHRTGRIGGHPVRLIRTDTGIDVLCASDASTEVSRALISAGAVPVDQAAVDCVRVERGRPRYGVDIDETVIPQEAGLNDRAVSFTKGCYVGQETVARLYYRGKPNRELRGLRSETPIPAGTELIAAGRVVGTVTSTAVSPAFGPVALALVRREAEPGATVSAGEAGEARVVALPFA